MRSAASQWIAITRGVSPAIADCELTHLDRRPIDFEQPGTASRIPGALRALGCECCRSRPALPDSVFVKAPR
jgi:hypothetical protein